LVHSAGLAACIRPLKGLEYNARQYLPWAAPAEQRALRSSFQVWHRTISTETIGELGLGYQTTYTVRLVEEREMGVKEKRWALVGGEVVTPLRCFLDGVVVGTGGKIEFVGSEPPPELLAGREVRDVTGRIIAPGFVDIHVHGGNGADFMDGSLEAFATACAAHAKGGTTALLPTTVATSLETTVETLRLVEQAQATRLPGAQVLGAHVEGPWFAAARKGAHDEVWAPRQGELDAFLEWAHVIKRLTLAPELAGALDVIRALRKAGILPSAGHTDATYAQMMDAVEAGLTHVTHLWNQTSVATKVGPYRHGGCTETALLEEDLTVELIADGHHVPPELMRLTVKCKGIDKLCVVSDAMRGAGMPEGSRWPVGPENSRVIGVIRDGVAVLPDNSAFASSVSLMDRMVRNARSLIGLSLPDAIRLATLTPAQIIGAADRKGSLVAGKDADIVILDKDLHVVETIALGEPVFRRGD
jgi:N-acetylglucosamine-6-phosphate deacetylase